MMRGAAFASDWRIAALLAAPLLLLALAGPVLAAQFASWESLAPSVEPFAYLKATLEAIAGGHPQSRLDDLLPWNFQPSS
jgi:hypothetical protein